MLINAYDRVRGLCRAVVGPNPYKPYTFAEALHLGRLYVVCYGCGRYAFVSKARHGHLDTRTTTWSCCICGGEGKATWEEPSAHFREDTRVDPQRHPRATSRLTGRPYRLSKAVQLREAAKDRRRERG